MLHYYLLYNTDILILYIFTIYIYYLNYFWNTDCSVS